MTFLQMQQELSGRLTAYDETVSQDATQLKRWLNMAQQFICGRMNWPFMLAQEIIQTVTDYTTGTCAVGLVGTTVTFSATIALSKTNHFIKFSDTDNWYQITAHTAGAATATISPAFGGAAALTAATYTIRKLWYATSTPLQSILDIKRLDPGSRIVSLSPRAADMFLPLYNSTGVPYQYISSVPASDGGLQFSLLYSPADTANLMVRGIKALSDLSADSDVSVIPTRWHPGVVAQGAYYGFTALDDDRAKPAFEEADIVVQDMARVFSHDLGRHRVMRPVDDENQFGGPVWVMPDNFGIPGS